MRPSTPRASAARKSNRPRTNAPAGQSHLGLRGPLRSCSREAARAWKGEHLHRQSCRALSPSGLPSPQSLRSSSRRGWRWGGNGVETHLLAPAIELGILCRKSMIVSDPVDIPVSVDDDHQQPIGLELMFFGYGVALESFPSCSERFHSSASAYRKDRVPP